MKKTVVYQRSRRSLAQVAPYPDIVRLNPTIMALLEILEYPDPRLFTKAQPVERIDASVQRLVEDMAETMYAAPGIGLAATQVNVHRRVIVIDVSEERDALLVLINPELIVIEGERVSEEGCLSVPGIFEPVRRAARVVVRAPNQHAEPLELAAEDMLAVCIQHEIDHLEGRVFVDKLSQLKRSRIRARLQKRDRVRASA